MTVTRSSENFNKIQVGTNAYIGPDAVTNAADFANAQMYIGQADTGLSYPTYIQGLVVESAASATTGAFSIVSSVLTNGANPGQAIRGEAGVTASADTGGAVGVVGVANDTHAGGSNTAFYATAANGATGYNFAYYATAGDLQLNDGKAIINDNGTYAADWSNAKLFAFEGDTANPATSAHIGIATEAIAVNADQVGIGVYSVAMCNGNKDSRAVFGKALVGNTADTAAAYGGYFQSSATHASGANYGVYSTCYGSSVSNYSFYGAAGDFMNVDGTAIFNDDGTNAADFANAQMYVYQGNTGGTTGSYTGIATEAAADVSSSAIGTYSAAKAFGSNSGMGVYGLGKVNATGDTATAYGGNFSSVDTHAGGDNIGVRGNAANGANNYSFYGEAGDIYNAGTLLLAGIKSGATQVAAGAAANELWKTASHATLPDNVVMIGV